MKKLLIATTNPGKLREYRELLKGFPFKLLSVEDLGIKEKAKEDGKTFEENAIKKSKFYSDLTGLPTLADDGGLEIDFLNGEPGIKSRKWLGYEASDEELIDYALKKLKGVSWKKRKAQFRVIVALAIPGKKVLTTEGKLRGIILTKPRGKLIPGYPFRVIFYLPNYGKAFSQLAFKEEVKIGHRGKAIKKLMKLMLKIIGIKPKMGFIGEERENILEDLNFAAQNRFDCYEIQAIKSIKGKEGLDLRPEIINQIKKISNDNKISLSLHTSHFIPLSSGIPEFSKAAYELVKRELILAYKIGAKRVTIHCGYKDISTVKNFEILVKNLKKLIKLGGKYKLEIGIENGFRPGYLCKEPEELLKVVRSVKGLKIVFDIGHSNVAGFDPIEYFRKVREFIAEVHLHDNDGKFDQHTCIGDGNINFKKFLRECKNLNYYGPFILEIFPRKEALKGKEIFLKLWKQI